VVIDLLSVIILRPSIWNLDLCLHLLPPIADLLASKAQSHEICFKYFLTPPASR
jgi:katanin p80 WD40 repeat-containing subunit B1